MAHIASSSPPFLFSLSLSLCLFLLASASLSRNGSTAQSLRNERDNQSNPMSFPLSDFRSESEEGAQKESERESERENERGRGRESERGDYREARSVDTNGSQEDPGARTRACAKLPVDVALRNVSNLAYNFWQPANVTSADGLGPEQRFYSPVVYIPRGESTPWVLCYGGARLEQRQALQDTYVLVLEQPAFWMLLSQASPVEMGPRYGHSLTSMSMQQAGSLPPSSANITQWKRALPLLFGGCEYFMWISVDSNEADHAGDHEENVQTCHNDMWTFDEALGWTSVNVTGSARPKARMMHAAQRLLYQHDDGPLDECLVIFGGIDTQSKALGDTWLFHVASRRWVQMTTGASPTPRLMAADALLNNRMYLLGGRDDDLGRQFSDFWSLSVTAPNCADAVWVQHDYPPHAPQNVSDTTLTGIPDEGMLVLHSGIRKRLHFDPNTWRWTEADGPQAWEMAPVERISPRPPAR